MMNLPFLTRFTLRLASRSDAIDAEQRRKLAGFFWAAQDRNGGFRGRQGIGDLYYTSFALRGLALLGEMSRSDVLDAVTLFLRNSLNRLLREKKTPFVMEPLSLLLCATLLEITENRDVFADSQVDRDSWMLETFLPFRRSDGGFAASGETAHAGTYHTFLVLSCFELFDLLETILDSEDECVKLVDFFLQRQKADGGFVEMKPLRHSGSNPTVAATISLGILENTLRKWDARRESGKIVETGVSRECGAFRAENKRDRLSDVFGKICGAKRTALVFLRNQETGMGGFRANTRIGVPDLLTTFTVLTAMRDQSSPDKSDFSLDAERTNGFLEQLRDETDDRLGFRGGFWDKEPDVEYTFYGLALQLLLHENQ